MITLSQLIERIRIVAATEPDFVYPPIVCTYLPNEMAHCGCIVGEALADLGVDRALLQIIDHLAPQGIPVNWAARPVIAVLGDVVERDALLSLWVSRVQNLQDEGVSWGDAIKTADLDAAMNGWVRS